jgi:hypothetical protein
MQVWVLAGLVASVLMACSAARADEPRKEAKEPPKEEKTTNAEADVSKARVEGVVVDEMGRPVEGAIVGTLAPASLGATPVRTSADGTFSLVLNSASARYHTIRASAEDGARQGLYRFHDTVLSQVAHARIIVKPSRRMAVYVTDAANKPLPGAAVAVFEESLRFLDQAETGLRGTALFRIPGGAKVFQVVALKPRVGFDYFENYHSWPGPVIVEPPLEVALTLDGARSIAVHATDSADKPVGGIDLVPWTVKKKGKLAYANLSGVTLKHLVVKTDRDGLAVFDWIPTKLEEGITFLHHSAEHSLPDSPHYDPTRPDKPLVAKLVRNAPISGKVTLPDGKPAGGILLQVEGRGNTNHYFRNVVRTKADGTWSLSVYANQSYIVAITDDHWAAPSKTGVVVREGESRKDLDFRLGKGTLLRGRVTVGKEKKPAAGQIITLLEQGENLPADLGGNGSGREDLVRWAETDAEGRYQIRLGSGRYQILGPGGNRMPRDEIKVKDEETKEKDWHLERLQKGLLKGVVLAHAEDGKPIRGAVVRGDTGQYAPFEAVADEKGHFEIDRMRGATFLYARNPEGTLATMVRTGEDDDDVKLILSNAGELRGRLTNRAGSALAGVRILCSLRTGPDAQPHTSAGIYVKTDDAGRFCVTGIVPGVRCILTAFDSKTNEKLKELPATRAEPIELGDFIFESKE